MANNKEINVNKHVSYEELIKKYHAEKNSRVKERLLVMIYLYEENVLMIS